MALIAGATIGAGALGAGSSLFGSKQAKKAAQSAADLQKQQMQTTQGYLGPYVQAGQGVLPNLTALVTGSPTGGGPNYIGMAQGNMPGTFTEAQLEATPGYQFIKDQGLKSVQAANAAKGLGVSGAALKGAGQYVTGLADQTYQQMFNMQQQNFANYLNLNTAQQQNLQNQYNRLAGVAGIGESAAAGQGQIGAGLAGAAGSYINQAGLAGAAGTSGVSSALNQGIGNYLGYSQLQNLINPTGGTAGYTGNPLSNANLGNLMAQGGGFSPSGAPLLS